MELASLSSEYLLYGEGLLAKDADIKAAEVNALNYSTGTDLIYLLIASDAGMDKLSVIHDAEANA